MGLLLTPGTEVVDGTLGDLVRAAGQFPEAGVFGVRQVNGQGKLEPSMRRFPTLPAGSSKRSARTMGPRRAMVGAACAEMGSV